jgi:hypothetical protein
MTDDKKQPTIQSSSPALAPPDLLTPEEVENLRRAHHKAYNLITIAENEFSTIVKNLNSGGGKKD